MSREDAMLGVFASRQDSDEEDYANGDAELLKSFNYDERRSRKSTINFTKSSSDQKKEKPPVKKEPIIVSERGLGQHKS
jgi:hypothetical protein